MLLAVVTLEKSLLHWSRNSYLTKDLWSHAFLVYSKTTQNWIWESRTLIRMVENSSKSKSTSVLFTSEINLPYLICFLSFMRIDRFQTRSCFSAGAPGFELDSNLLPRYKSLLNTQWQSFDMAPLSVIKHYYELDYWINPKSLLAMIQQVYSLCQKFSDYGPDAS